VVGNLGVVEKVKRDEVSDLLVHARLRNLVGVADEGPFRAAHARDEEVCVLEGPDDLLDELKLVGNERVVRDKLFLPCVSGVQLAFDPSKLVADWRLVLAEVPAKRLASLGTFVQDPLSGDEVGALALQGQVGLEAPHDLAKGIVGLLFGLRVLDEPPQGLLGGAHDPHPVAEPVPNLLDNRLEVQQEVRAPLGILAHLVDQVDEPIAFGLFPEECFDLIDQLFCRDRRFRFQRGPGRTSVNVRHLLGGIQHLVKIKGHRLVRLLCPPVARLLFEGLLERAQRALLVEHLLEAGDLEVRLVVAPKGVEAVVEDPRHASLVGVVIGDGLDVEHDRVDRHPAYGAPDLAYVPLRDRLLQRAALIIAQALFKVLQRLVAVFCREAVVDVLKKVGFSRAVVAVDPHAGPSLGALRQLLEKRREVVVERVGKEVLLDFLVDVRLVQLAYGSDRVDAPVDGTLVKVAQLHRRRQIRARETSKRKPQTRCLRKTRLPPFGTRGVTPRSCHSIISLRQLARYTRLDVSCPNSRNWPPS